MLKTAAVAIFTAISLLGSALADSPAPPDDVKATKYRSMQIDGLTVAYREAGPPEAPTVLLLHGFPSSSRMYQRLLPLLSDRYHLVAPDYVGFGHSDAPDPSHFDYTFDHLADIVAKMVSQMGLTHYTLFMQDYGGPIGFRLALRRPEAVDAMIIQNAVAHEQGWGRCGRRGGHSGPIAPPTRPSCAPVSCRSRPRSRGISATVRVPNSMIPMPGPTSSPSSSDPAKLTCRPSCSMI